MESKPESAAGAGTPRRTVLAAVSGVGLTLAGCSTYGGTERAAPSTSAAPPSASIPEPSGTASPTESATPSATESVAPPANALAQVSDIPVGGGKIFNDQKVVVTQPQAGTIKAFSAVCTHAGCLVGSVGRTIDCPCHGSKFSIEDGSVVNPPASSPLPAAKVTVQGGSIVLA